MYGPDTCLSKVGLKFIQFCQIIYLTFIFGMEVHQLGFVLDVLFEDDVLIEFLFRHENSGFVQLCLVS